MFSKIYCIFFHLYEKIINFRLKYLNTKRNWLIKITLAIWLFCLPGSTNFYTIDIYSCEIIRKNGLGTNGIYLGVNATLWRHGFIYIFPQLFYLKGVWNLFYFGLYHNLKALFISTNNSFFYLFYLNFLIFFKLD